MDTHRRPRSHSLPAARPAGSACPCPSIDDLKPTDHPPALAEATASAVVARTTGARRWRAAALGLALLLVAYPLSSSLAFEPLLRWAAARWLADHGGYRLVLAQAQWRPWQLALALRGVSLQAPDGTPMLDLGGAIVDLELASLWRRAVVVADLQLDQPVLHWHVQADGRSNWGDFIQAAGGPAPAVPETLAPARLWAQQVGLREGRLLVQDASVPGGFKTGFDALTWQAQDLSTLPGLQGRHRGSARSEIGASVHVAGTLALNPVAAGGTLALDGLSLARLAPLLKPWLDTRDLSGQAAATLAYQVDAREGHTSLKLTDVDVQGQGLAWQDRGAGAPLTAMVQRLRVHLGADASLGPGPPSLHIRGLGVELSGLRVSGDGQPQPWLDLETVTTTQGRLAWPDRQLDLGQVSLAQGRVQVRRDVQGGIALLQAVQGRLSPPAAAPAAAPVATPAASSSPAWRWRVGPSRLSEIALAWQDESVQPAAGLTLTALDGELGALSDDPAAVAPARLRLQVDSGGRVDLQGQVTVGQRRAALDLLVDGLVLAPAAPYVTQSTALALADGRVGLRGQVQLDGAQWRYRGGFALQQLRLNERATGERLLSWDTLAADMVEADASSLHVGELALRGLVGRFTIFPDSTTNLARVLQKPARRPPPAPLPAPGSAAGPPLGGYGITVDRVRVGSGTVDFADLSLALPFGARIEGLGGQIVGISTAPGAQTQLALEGRVAPAGLARVGGRFRAFDPRAETDLKLLFRNVEMTTLTPYAATFAGRRIDSGILSLDLQYRIEQGRLQGDNQVVMDHLVLGDKVGAAGTRELPLDLAIALLEDADGRIDLGLPVSGSLEDPQFALGPLVWKALTGALVKAATAPFQALAGLGGAGDGPPLDRIDFDPGRADLTPPERAKLARLGQALQRRPGVGLTVQAPFDTQADGAALREQALSRAIALESGRSVPAGEDPGPIEPSQPATLAALQRLYTGRIGAPLPTDAQALLQRLRTSEALPATALEGLARQRAEAIRSELVADGVDGARVQLAPPRSQSSGRVTLSATLGIERRTAGPKGG